MEDQQTPAASTENDTGSTFKFALGQRVKLIESGEEGTVTARAQYLHSKNNYEVLYKAGDGRQVNAWWNGAFLKAA